MLLEYSEGRVQSFLSETKVEARQKVKCSQCSQSVRIPPDKMGTRVRCPSCRQNFLAETTLSTSPADTLDSKVARIEGATRASDESPKSPDVTSSESVSEPTFKFVKVIGRFQIRGELGQGGFGKVYEAFDPQLGRTIALKVPTFGADNPRRVRRFVTEARSAARLHHPNIVAVYENGQTDDGQLFIASELVHGSTLRHLLETEEILLREKVAWVRDLAEALAYARSEGIVHRDIKPENILIDSVHRRPKIVDFGLAKVLDDDGAEHDAPLKTRDGILGTPAFMSPEQARGELSEVGPHSDQYSLGAVLYQCLTKRPPFSGSVYVIVAAVGGSEEPLPIRQLSPEVPKDLASICEKAMCKQMAARYSDARQFGEDLQRWLDDEPVKARPISPISRLIRKCRRNPVVASLSTILFLVLVTATIILQTALQNAVSQKEQATASEKEAKKQAKEAEDAKLIAERATADAERQKGIAEEQKKTALESENNTKVALTEMKNAKESLATTLRELQHESNRATTAEVAKTTAEQVQKDLRLASVLERANTDYIKGVALLDNAPAHGLLWMAKALVDMDSNKERNEPVRRFEELVRTRIASEMPRLPQIESSFQVSGRIEAPEHVTFSRHNKLVAVVADNVMSVKSTLDGQAIYKSEFQTTKATGTQYRFKEGDENRFGDTRCNALIFTSDAESVVLFRGSVYKSLNEFTKSYNGGSTDSRIEVHDLKPESKTPMKLLTRADNAPISWFCPAELGTGTTFVARGFDANWAQFNRLMYLDESLRIKHGTEVGAIIPVTAVAGGRRVANVLVATGQSIRRISPDLDRAVPLIEFGRNVINLAVSPDDKQLAVSLDGGEVRLYSTESMQFRSLNHPDKEIYSIEFSEDSMFLVTASSDNLVRVWSCADGSLRSIPIVHPAPVFALALQHDRLMTACEDGSLRHWLLPNTTETRVFQIDHASSARFSPNSRQIIAANFRATQQSLTLYDLLSGEPTAIAELGLTAAVTDIEFDKSGQMVAISSGNRILFFRANNLQLVQTLDLPFHAITNKGLDSLEIAQVRIAGDANVGGCVLTDGRVFYWSDLSKNKARLMDVGLAASIAISESGQSIAVGTTAGKILLADAKGRLNPASFSPTEVQTPVTALEFSDDEKRIAVGTQSGALFVIDAVTGQLQKTFNGGAGTQTKELQFLSGGLEIAAISSSRLEVWSIATGAATLKRTLGPSGGSLAISASGQYCLQGSQVEFIPRVEVIASAVLQKLIESRSGIRLTKDGLVEFVNTSN